MSTESLAFVSAALFEHSLVLLLVGITRRFCDPRKRLSTLIPKLAPPESPWQPLRASQVNVHQAHNLIAELGLVRLSCACCAATSCHRPGLEGHTGTARPEPAASARSLRAFT
jgi:hypothetical protein